MPDCREPRRYGPGATLYRVVPVLLAVAGLASPASADYKRGERALGMLDYVRAMAEFRSAVADGDRRALFEIGLIYERGHGVPEDAAEAARWYRKAARENTDLAPRALAGRALARVEGKDDPVPSAASGSRRKTIRCRPRHHRRSYTRLSRLPPKPSPGSRRQTLQPLPRHHHWSCALDGTSFGRGSTESRIHYSQLRSQRPSAQRGNGGRRPANLVYNFANVKAKDAPAEARLWAVRQGRDLFQEGRYAEATPFVEKALELSDRQLGPEHAETGALLHDLAKLMRIQGRNAEAEPLYKRSVDVFEKALGAEHPRLAGSLDGLAGLYLVQGRLDDAEPLYGRSLAIREQALGAAHPLVAASLNNLAELYRGQGRYAEAEPLHKRSLAIS